MSFLIKFVTSVSRTNALLVGTLISIRDVSASIAIVSLRHFVAIVIDSASLATLNWLMEYWRREEAKRRGKVVGSTPTMVGDFLFPRIGFHRSDGVSRNSEVFSLYFN